MMNSVSWVDEKVADSPPALVKRRRSGKQRAAPPGPAAEKESVYEFDVEEAREAPKKKKKKKKHKAEPKVKIVKAKENLDVVNKPKPKVRKSPRTPAHDDDDEEEEDTPALRVRRKGTTPKGMVFKVLGTR